MYPLDTLKTRIQSPEYSTLYKVRPTSATATSSSTSSLSPKFPAFTAVRRTFSSYTNFNPALFRGLYQGVSTVILVTIPSSGAFFTTYEALKSSISGSVPPNSTLYLPEPAIHAVSSGGAELVSCAILTPAEVLKQNAQMVQQQQQQYRKGRGHFRSSRHPTLQVLQDFRSHPTKLFRGYTALAARNLPFTGLQFPLFEHLKTYFLDRRKRQKIETDSGAGRHDKVDGILERARITAMSAAIAGTGAAWITTPIDVIKTRIMLGASDEARSHSSSKPSPSSTSDSSSSPKQQRQQKQTASSVIRTVLRTQGIPGLFRGALLRSLWTAFGSGLYLGCYEGGRHYLEDRRERRDGELDGRRRTRSEPGEDVINERDWKQVKIGVGESRSQEGGKIGRSRWED